MKKIIILLTLISPMAIASYHCPKTINCDNPLCTLSGVEQFTLSSGTPAKNTNYTLWHVTNNSVDDSDPGYSHVTCEYGPLSSPAGHIFFSSPIYAPDHAHGDWYQQHYGSNFEKVKWGCPGANSCPLLDIAESD
jgi:hypothetical protein